MKLEKILNISGTIYLITGLHIGAGKDSIEIGGLDLPIIKNPMTGAPYIPGSSIKGKMRSLLEVTQLMDKYTPKPQLKPNNTKNGEYEPCGCSECKVCTIFGTHKASNEVQNTLLPTRLLMRDAVLTEQFTKMFKEQRLKMEIKYENTINRVTGTAMNPRPIERVPAGTEFDFNMVIRVYNDDDENEFLDIIKMGLKLIECDALGGNSSRGCGQVRFDNLKMGNTLFDLSDINFS